MNESILTNQTDQVTKDYCSFHSYIFYCKLYVEISYCKLKEGKQAGSLLKFVIIFLSIVTTLAFSLSFENIFFIKTVFFK